MVASFDGLTTDRESENASLLQEKSGARTTSRLALGVAGTAAFVCLASFFALRGRGSLDAPVQAKFGHQLLLFLTDSGAEVSAASSLGVPDFEAAACHGSTYFIDLGSTGMKVYRAHPKSNDSKSEILMKGSEEKISIKAPLGSGLSPDYWLEVLEELQRRLPEEGRAAQRNGAVLATAGLRLASTRAKQIWETIRNHSDELAFLGDCDKKHREGCRTLSGYREAFWELNSIFDSEAGALLESEPNVGFASCGGASLQIGLRGDQDTLAQCKHDLGKLDNAFDDKRVAILKVKGQPTLLVSFLSDHELNCTEKNVCDYIVGGVNEMRASLDIYLKEKLKMEYNPCVGVNSVMKASDACSFFKTKTCIVDEFGGLISGLPPAPSSLFLDKRAEHCKSTIKGFFGSDLMLRRWTRSSSCRKLTQNIEKWGLTSSFARKAQLGAAAEVWTPFKDLRNAAAQVILESDTGKFLTSALLLGFLETLGLEEEDKLLAIPSDWGSEAMDKHGLALGWLSSEACPGS